MKTRNTTNDSAPVSSSNLNSFSNRYYEILFEKKFLHEGEFIFKCDCFHIEDIPKNIAPFKAPKLAYIELTSECNNNCYGCNYKSGGNKFKKSLTFDQWQIILNKLKRNVLHLHITGGEPTLHPDFEKIIKYLQNINISFTLFSNARWLNHNLLLSLLSTVPQFQGFLISLHGCTAKQHDAFTNIKNSFIETVTNIRHAVDKGYNVHLSTVITKQNYNKINEIAEFSFNLGVRCINFNRYIGPFIAGISPASSELKIAIRNIELIKEDGTNIQFGNCIPQCFQKSSSSGCLAGTAFCSIDPWGNVRPCNHASLNCGNLFHQSMDKVWNSKTMKHWRNFFPNECESCLEFSNCHGGCRAEAIISGIDKDPLAKMAA